MQNASAAPALRPIGFPADRSDGPFRWSGLPFDANRIRMLSLSAPYSLQEPDDLHDDLPGVDTDGGELYRATLKEWWGVESSADCHDTLSRLSEARMSGDYDVIAPLAERALEFPAGHEIENAHLDFLADLERANGLRPERFTLRYRQWTAALRDPGFRRHLPEFLPLEDFGWDLMRTGSFGRASVQSGYLTAAELGAYLHTALGNAQRLAGHWRTFASSFLVGRAFANLDSAFGDAREQAAHVASRVRRCLADPDSPWVRVPLLPEE
ncbi:MAG TPA: DUF1266 domain-containing protein [Candidatus Brachybacterium merdigallinarum]|nr:DUF1266 domain-containing protein [Candidatus Brachybacterium merdigallinarum]